MSQLYVPELPKDLLKHDFSNKVLNNNEEIISYVSSKIEYVPYQGIIVHIIGATHPKKGFPMPESVAGANIMKTVLRELSRHPLATSLAVIMDKNKFFESLLMVFNKTCLAYMLKKEYLCPAAYATHRFVKHFLHNIGVKEEFAEGAGSIFAYIIEFDDAYRYRFQDIISEAHPQELIHRPNKEIPRLLNILKEREDKDNTTAIKIIKMVKPLMYALYLPTIKKAYKKAAPHLLGAAYDEGDRYWACLKGDLYKFTGKNYEERTKGLEIPKPVKVNL